MNYRAWNHRCWLVSYMTREQVLHELKKSRNWAGLHVADNCCFHYRRVSFLMNLNKLRCKFCVLTPPPLPLHKPFSKKKKKSGNHAQTRGFPLSSTQSWGCKKLKIGKIYTNPLKDEVRVHHSYYFQASSLSEYLNFASNMSSLVYFI